MIQIAYKRYNENTVRIVKTDKIRYTNDTSKHINECKKAKTHTESICTTDR